jgi:hypothetical protein
MIPSEMKGLYERAFGKPINDDTRKKFYIRLRELGLDLKNASPSTQVKSFQMQLEFFVREEQGKILWRRIGLNSKLDVVIDEIIVRD